MLFCFIFNILYQFHCIGLGVSSHLDNLSQSYIIPQEDEQIELIPEHFFSPDQITQWVKKGVS